MGFIPFLVRLARTARAVRVERGVTAVGDEVTPAEQEEIDLELEEEEEEEEG